MRVSNCRMARLRREKIYDTIIGKDEMARRKEKTMQKESADSVVNAFKMFYRKNYSDAEWNEIIQKTTLCGVEATVSMLKKELEKKGIKTEAWVRMSEKMFL